MNQNEFMRAKSVLVTIKILGILVTFLLCQNIINCFRFYHRSNEFRNLMPRTEKTKIKKKNVNIINYIINKTI